jgi:CBS domain-containing protein
MQIDEASDLMIRNDIGCLPIVKGKELIGIVTNKDLKKHDQDKGGTA